MIKYINTYPERNKFLEENKRVGFNCVSSEVFNLWVVELYKNKETGKYSIMLVADEDEQLATIEFEDCI